ncbi:MAG: hypothetical protein HN909_01260 [Phycisphaerales bacterium]|nr:hypothetical protein [Phycisphaerales bacterium]MBT7170378.1 hypothetical protein [Phycisphaerales bacterium]
MKRRTWRANIGTFAVFLVIAGCVAAETKAPAKASKPVTAYGKTVIIEGIPHVKQKTDFCGEACVEMHRGWVLREKKLAGELITQDDVFAAAKLNPCLGRGCYAPNLYVALDRLGYKLAAKTALWQNPTTKLPQAKLTEQCFGELVADLRKNVPSIVCMKYSDKPKTTEHFRLVVGYDAKTDEVVYREPAQAPLKDKAYRRMSRTLFFKLWPIGATKTLIRFGLAPGEKMKWTKKALWGSLIRATAAPDPSPADYAQHIMKIKTKYPFLKTGYSIGAEGPFIVVGNMSGASLDRYITGTIRWAHSHFRNDYFAKNPPKIITVFLLADTKTYKAVAKAVSGDPPDTPYGYFSSYRNAMVMNIRTGGGTLVHEMFHAYGPANIPDMPSWINEGMASLYEQCGTRKVGSKQQIIGRTNWRLAGLQKHIKAKTTVPFGTLCQTTDRQFYSTASGYAQARYLMYYLQEKHKLRAFWADYLKTRKEDPSGWTAMKTTLADLGHKDIPKFQAEWEKWVLELKFP